LAWIPYFVTPHPLIVKDERWGKYSVDNGEMTLFVSVNFEPLVSQYGAQYQAMVVAIHFFGNVDQYDAEGLQKSAAFDLRDGPSEFAIHADKAFQTEFTKGNHGTNYVIMLIPRSISPDQFRTIRQAIALGAIIVTSDAGPP
jgi:hypothetical protein